MSDERPADASEQNIDQPKRVMSDEDYAKQPESNVGATVDRDIDPPNAKPAPENDPNVVGDEVQVEAQEELQANMQSTADQVQDEVTHGEQVTNRQHEKFKPEQ